MGFMNYIETFFFFSLAISFVLILLLVYHFKQRMTTLEQKSDTMVSIINDIAKELTYVRQISTNYMMTSVSHGNMGAYAFPPPFHQSHDHGCSDRVEVDDSEDDEDDDEDDDDDEDEDDDEDDDEEDGPSTHIIQERYGRTLFGRISNNIPENDVGVCRNIVVSDTEVESDDVKVVCLEHSTKDDFQETCGKGGETLQCPRQTSFAPDTVLPGSPEARLIPHSSKMMGDQVVTQDYRAKPLRSVRLGLQPENSGGQRPYEFGIDDEPKFTNIADIDMDCTIIPESEPIDISDESPEIVVPVPSVQPDIDMYRKMSTQVLKAAVLASRLSEDPSKMKKPELLQLLGAGPTSVSL